MQIWRQWSQRLLNQEQLVQFILPWKQRISINQLTHYAGYSPHVNLLSVVPTDKQLRWTIPSCSNVVSDFLSFFFFDLASKSKVTNFKLEIRGDKEILGFDVAMDDVLLMKIVEAFDELEDEFSDERKFYSI